MQHRIIAIGCIILIIAMDQLSKTLIMDSLLARPYPVVPITSFFNMVLVFNPGVSFGMFDSLMHGRWILLVLTLAIVLGLSIWMWRVNITYTRLALAIIIGGALGNAIDRVYIGAVVDFLDFHAFGYHWPAFNIADSCVFVGALMLVLEPLFINNKIKGMHDET